MNGDASDSKPTKDARTIEERIEELREQAREVELGGGARQDRKSSTSRAS